MKKRKLRIFACLLVLTVVMSLLSACKEEDGSGYTFKINLEYNPKNLDPQLAEDISSKTVIANMFEGLVRMNSDGSIAPACAETYSVSEDGLTYTFKLKENVYWESVNGYKAKVTAGDFVFAFQRIFDPKDLYSPYVEEFSCIKNASDIAAGKVLLRDLGVKATDEFTLQIELEYPYYDFLELLTTSAAMPCSREFFESTKGRYGLAAETTASNGAFYMKEWNYDPYWDNNYIIMRRNKSNSSEDLVYPYSLNYFITGNSENDAAAFSKGDIDCTILEKYDKKLAGENNSKAYATKAYGLLFNEKAEYFSNAGIRSALASSFSRSAYGGLDDGDLIPAYGTIPPGVTILGKSYRDMVADNSLEHYDPEAAAEMWKLSLSYMNMEAIDGVKITVPESFSGVDYLNLITEQWQENLGFFCGIEVVSMNEYEMKLSEGSFSIALVEITSEENSPAGFLRPFWDGKPAELFGYGNIHLNSLLGKVTKAASLNEAVELYSSAEKSVIDSFAYIPLFYGNEYFISPTSKTDIEYKPFTREIYFRNAKNFD